jgi:cyanophycinase
MRRPAFDRFALRGKPFRPSARRQLRRVAGLLAVALAFAGSLAHAQAPRVGPERGTLIVAGGGRLGPEIVQRFIDLAGGDSARIVIIPTAGEEESFNDDYGGYRMFRDVGVKDITVIHTRDPKEADLESFVAPLRRATGVWIPGGRQWRLADSYLRTRTLRELFNVLERGGVIGGSSAGASIQASYMVRGAVEGNTIMMAEGHEEGFGFLRGVAVDQHIIARGRESDLQEVVTAHPELLGIGIDESTAIEVHGDRATVIGKSKAAFHNTTDAAGARYYFLQSGDIFDLAGRRTIKGAPEMVK